MDRVLIDASTALFVSDILEGRGIPNAINLLNLASFLESVILHRSITILNTNPGGEHDSRLDAIRAQFPDGVVRVVQKEPFSLLQEWRALRDEDSRAGPEMWSDLYLDLTRSDEELQNYVQTLQTVFDHYWRSGSDGNSRKPGTNPLVVHESPPGLNVSMGRFVRREKMFPDTLFNEWYLHGEGRQFDRFAEGSIIRAQLYLCAAEVFDAPYKPDALRWPLCWKLLTNAPLSRVRDEALIKHALQEEIVAAEQVQKIFGAGAVSLGIPLFLRTILQQSSAPEDILPAAIKIRYSSEAERFRAFCKQMRQAIVGEELIEALRGLNDYTLAIRRVFGESKTPEVMWTLVEGGVAATKAGIAGLTPTAFLDLAPKTKGPLSELRSWWRRRRFALITKSIMTAKQAGAFRLDVKRIFGRAIPDSELRMLQRITRAA